VTLDEITPEMLDAGEEVILNAVGGADVGGNFSAVELAATVYLAMHRAMLAKNNIQPGSWADR
jgi:hypothetical protein